MLYTSYALLMNIVGMQSSKSTRGIPKSNPHPPKKNWFYMLQWKALENVEKYFYFMFLFNFFLFTQSHHI